MSTSTFSVRLFWFCLFYLFIFRPSIVYWDVFISGTMDVVLYSCCMRGVVALMLQPIQYQETCQLVDHNYNLSVLAGPTWTSQQRKAGRSFSFSRHQTRSNCQNHEKWVISQSVIVSCSGAFLSWKNELPSYLKIFKFRDRLWFWHCAIK